ncbi:rhodanese-like domain-containing protein [Limisalsivibrio acetivorans]|uniref:rhodanese-like domain-containing protein n=1 Tax=Limisalsivibrio acetivorans TaxID=1304888 RepID=UPI0003B6DDED|nr:rhodanese-like domain-containing protein [Limisalsivibrio acetivorans]
MKKLIFVLIMILTIPALFAQTVDSIKPGKEEGSVDRKWLKKTIKNGIPENIVFIDVRSDMEHEDDPAPNAKNVPVNLFIEDNGCELFLEQIPGDKYVIFVCPYGPRAEESYFNLKDPVEDGGCGYTGNNIFWNDGKVKFKESGIVIK